MSTWAARISSGAAWWPWCKHCQRRSRATHRIEKAPRRAGALRSNPFTSGARLRCDLGFDRLAVLGALDADGPRLHRLGNFAHEIDVQQAVLQRGGLHLDEIGESEYPLEGPRGD